MKLGKSIIKQKQCCIYLRIANEYYNDLRSITSRFISQQMKNYGSFSYDRDSILSRDYEQDIECLSIYCLRTRMIHFAEKVCEFYCKAIFMENNGAWNDAKSLGKNILDCYNLLCIDDKKLLSSIPIDYVRNIANFYPLFITTGSDSVVGNNESYQKNETPITDYLLSFADGKILPNIKAQNTELTTIDFYEQFVLVLAKLLYSFVYNKQTQRLISSNSSVSDLYKFELFGKD